MSDPCYREVLENPTGFPIGQCVLPVGHDGNHSIQPWGGEGRPLEDDEQREAFRQYVIGLDRWALEEMGKDRGNGLTVRMLAHEKDLRDHGIDASELLDAQYGSKWRTDGVPGDDEWETSRHRLHLERRRLERDLNLATGTLDQTPVTTPTDFPLEPNPAYDDDPSPPVRGRPSPTYRCYARSNVDNQPCQQDMNHKGHHDDGSPRWSMRVNGARHCYDHPDTEYEYDSEWGAGLFTDWPRGHHKGFGE